MLGSLAIGNLPSEKFSTRAMALSKTGAMVPYPFLVGFKGTPKGNPNWLGLYSRVGSPFGVGGAFYYDYYYYYYYYYSYYYSYYYYFCLFIYFLGGSTDFNDAPMFAPQESDSQEPACCSKGSVLGGVGLQLQRSELGPGPKTAACSGVPFFFLFSAFFLYPPAERLE